MTEAEVVPAVQVVEWASIESSFSGDGEVGSGGALLLGNGFSSNIWSEFGYGTLLERSGLAGPARDLFRDRCNFETVLAELSTAQQIVGVVAPDADELLGRMDDLAIQVRDALLATVGKVHPEANRLLAGQKTRGKFGFVGVPVQVLEDLAKHMPWYSRVFVTNYDVISYWAAVQAGVADLFPSSDPFDVGLAEHWLANNSQPKIFFMHGALHLWRSLSTNVEAKHTASSSTLLLDVIKASVEHPDRLPLFISEGSSAEKVARIRSSQYLSFCARVLIETDAPLTVLGQALLDVDEHIRDAIEHHPDRKVAIGVYVGDIDDPDAAAQELAIRATAIRGRLAKCRDVVFFDSAEHPLTSSKLRCG